MANIDVNTKTYTGAGVINNVAQYIERSAGYASGFSVITGSLRVDSKGRATWKMTIPVIATVASASHAVGDIVDVSDVTVSARIGTKLSTAERTDVADRVKDLVAHATFRDTLINLAQPAG